jgi:hypothetical protein
VAVTGIPRTHLWQVTCFRSSDKRSKPSDQMIGRSAGSAFFGGKPIKARFCDAPWLLRRVLLLLLNNLCASKWWKTRFQCILKSSKKENSKSCGRDEACREILCRLNAWLANLIDLSKLGTGYNSHETGRAIILPVDPAAVRRLRLRQA